MWADLNIFIVKETEEMLMSPNKYPSIVESIKQEICTAQYHRYAGAVRYAELCEGYKAALLTETARSLRGAGQKADGQRAVGFCPFCRLCAGEAGDLLRKTERRKNFAKRGLTMEARVL